MTLHAYGDSWTEGQGTILETESKITDRDELMKFRKEFSYVKFLAEKVGIPYVNNGISGQSNLKIFNKIVSDENKAGEVYLGKMKKNLAGVVFDKNVIVPIQYIEMYWSNQGQKKCNSEIIKAEARLSIRFRIKEGDIVSYIYDPNSRILQRNPNQIVGGSFEKVYC